MPDYTALHAALADVQDRGLARSVAPLAPTGPTTARLQDGREVDVFSSNDCLGLAQHPEVVAAWRGAGTGSARLIAGDRAAHHRLEDALSDWMGRPCTVLSSGWHANLALTGALLGRSDRVSSDALIHASLIDGLRLTRAERTVLPHGTTAVPEGVRMHVTEGLFSMDGDTVDLGATRAACDAVGTWLYVDEAHAVGARGPGGRGVSAEQGVEPDFLVGTLGKAFGSYGAFVCGPPVLRPLLMSRGRAFIFTTGLPEPVCTAALAGLRLATDDRRRALDRNVARLRQGLTALGLHTPGDGHIVPVVLGAQTMGVATALLERGVHVVGIRPPTVAVGTERLRISVSAAHSHTQIDRLVSILGELIHGFRAEA